jgi:hypothetical protein
MDSITMQALDMIEFKRRTFKNESKRIESVVKRIDSKGERVESDVKTHSSVSANKINENKL